MKQEQPAIDCVVFVIDDDVSVRASLKSLFESVGLHVQLFESADAFLQSERPDLPCCLVLDVRMPGLSGLEFQSELAKAGTDVPIIFMTGHGDIPMTVQAMKAGAVEFLTKPCRDQELLDAVRSAIEGHRARRKEGKHIALLREQFASLTAREKEVVGFVTAGLLNKQIAAELDISEVTVKMHRGNIMRKMQARSLADLVRMADLLGVSRSRPAHPRPKYTFVRAARTRQLRFSKTQNHNASSPASHALRLLNPGKTGLSKTPMISIVDDDEFVREFDQGPRQVAWLLGAHVFLS